MKQRLHDLKVGAAEPTVLEIILRLPNKLRVQLPESWHLPGFCHSDFLFEPYFQ